MKIWNIGINLLNSITRNNKFYCALLDENTM